MHNTDNLLNYFTEYCNFFHVENQIALIDGRAYDYIMVFQNELDRLLFEPEKSKLKELKTAIATFIKGATEYQTHGYGGCVFADIIEDQIFNVIFNDDFKKLLDYYFTSYEQLSMVTDQDMHDILLVEFNDMLSHILIALMNKNNPTIFDSNISRAKGHIYRATLDGYKEIIAKEVYREKNEVNIPIDIQRRMFMTRLKEIKNIGGEVMNKFDLIDEYIQLAQKLMNRPD